MAGRPRLTEDAALVQAAVAVIGRVGPSRLTLAAVAAEAGVAPATLVQRFGSKRGLLLAIGEHSARQAAPTYERIRQQHASSLAALHAVIAESMAPMDTPETFANHLAFLCLDLTDPQLHAPALAVHEAQEHILRTVLDEAVAAGELQAGTDTADLAGAVQAMAAGTGLTWALDRQGTLAARVAQAVTTALAPHLVASEERDRHASGASRLASGPDGHTSEPDDPAPRVARKETA